MPATKKAPKTKVPKLNLTKGALTAFLEENRRKFFYPSNSEECVVAKFLNTQLPKGLYADIEDDEEITIMSKLKEDMGESREPVALKTLKSPKWMSDAIKLFDTEQEKMSGAKVLSLGVF